MSKLKPDIIRILGSYLNTCKYSLDGIKQHDFDADVLKFFRGGNAELETFRLHLRRFSEMTDSETMMAWSLMREWEGNVTFIEKRQWLYEMFTSQLPTEVYEPIRILSLINYLRSIGVCVDKKLKELGLVEFTKR